MRKTIKKGIALGLSLGLAVASLSGCQGSGRTADGKVKLSFQIWDTSQRAGMQSVVDSYLAQNPFGILSQIAVPGKHSKTGA